jgi:hypothetical protein
MLDASAREPWLRKNSRFNELIDPNQFEAG